MNYSELFSAEAYRFLEVLHQKFNVRRLDLLSRRQIKAAEIRAGKKLDFLSETASVRSSDWVVANAPADLTDRRVEITGPADAKMIINALNCDAKVFMADLEDSLSPTFSNIVDGQIALHAAVRKTLQFVGDNGKIYKLNEKTATLVVRPRGLHLDEAHLKINSRAASGSLVDFGLYFFHNAKELIARGSGPYFYLPKMESHLEARWWNEVFEFSQDYLKIPQGTIRATCLIETINAAFEMDEILFELRNHAAGLNAGRWDYIFSFIKKHTEERSAILPDRAQVTMTTDFLRSYCELLVNTCHRRQAHAIGGMSAFIPNRREPEVTKNALEKVRADKARESSMGFDGTWVAHPDLVAVAEAEFNKVLGPKANQKEVIKPVSVTAENLLHPHIPGGQITEGGVRANINVTLLYLDKWLSGVGAAAIHNLMEDAATAEISRSQLWQWLHHRVAMDDGREFTNEMYHVLLVDEVGKLNEAQTPYLHQAVQILNDLVLNEEFAEFLTTKSYETLRQIHKKGVFDDISSGSNATT